MLILLILLGVLVIGILRYAVNEFLEQSVDASTDDSLTPISPCRRNQIKHELDELLTVYQRGLLTEEQYISSTDRLIDELATLLDEQLVLQE